MGTLYMVATPIGNLEDITARAVRILGEVSLIAAEDTRHSLKLLNHLGIRNRLVSVHAFNEKSRVDTILAALAEGDVAFISDAGTPGISDPGAVLAVAAREAGYPVSPIPGPSAMTAAISVAGLVNGPFTMLGFLPRKAGARQELFARALATGFAILCFEAPGRVASTLAELAIAAPGRRAIVGRELTKLHEEIVGGTIEELASRFATHEARGEVVIALESGPVQVEVIDPEVIIEDAVRRGASANQAAKAAADATGRPKSELYPLAVEIKRRADQSG